MRAVEASAKTREDAIQNALSDLGVEMYDVDNIEVLDEGSRGLFGIGARPVRVKVTVENLPDEPKPKPRRDDRPAKAERGGRPERGSKPDRGGRSDRGGKQGRQENRGDKDRDKDKDKKRSERGKGPRGEKGKDRDKNRPQRPKNDEKRPDKRREAKKDAPKDRGDKAAAPSPEPLPKGARANEEEVYEPITDEQGKEAAALLQEIIGKMGIEAKVAFARISDGTARLNVESEDGAILIGRKGRNLSAMQYLVNRMVSRSDKAENTERMVVDVEGYVDRRRASLEDMARTMAKRAKESRRNMRLKPMSPQERRIIHVTLQDDKEVRTYSLGDSLYRSVVISPGNQDDRGRSSRGRRRGGRGRDRGRPSRPREQDSEIDAGQFGD